MGALAGFRCREIVKRLKQLGLEFHRQAAGSHEIWFNPASSRYTAIPNHPGDIRLDLGIEAHSPDRRGRPMGNPPRRVFMYYP